VILLGIEARDMANKF